MTKQSTPAALERLEGLAADFLEVNIADVEKAQGIKIKDVDVDIIPDGHGGGPAITVVVST